MFNTVLRVSQPHRPSEVWLEYYCKDVLVTRAVVRVGDQTAFISSLYVVDRFRRMGLGASMMLETFSRWPQCHWAGAGTKISDSFYAALVAQGIARDLGDGDFGFAPTLNKGAL